MPRQAHRRRPDEPVERGRLVRVLAVAQAAARARPPGAARCGKLVGLALGRRRRRRRRAQVGGDGRVVLGGAPERLLGQAEARGVAELAAAGAQLVEHRRVLAGDRSPRRRCRGSWPPPRIMLGPPMSIFSIASSSVTPGARHRLLERIERHDDQVDRRDAVLLERGQVRGHVAAGQDAAVHLRVQRLHAPVEHLGKAGDLGHVRAPAPRSRAAAWPCRPWTGSRRRAGPGSRANSTTPVLSCTLTSARRTFIVRPP